MSLVKGLYRTLLRGARLLDRDPVAAASIMARPSKLFDREHHKWEEVEAAPDSTKAEKELNALFWKFNRNAQFHSPAQDSGGGTSAESLLRDLFRSSSAATDMGLATHAVRNLSKVSEFSRIANKDGILVDGGIGFKEEERYALMVKVSPVVRLLQNFPLLSSPFLSPPFLFFR